MAEEQRTRLNELKIQNSELKRRMMVNMTTKYIMADTVIIRLVDKLCQIGYF